jgi:hypothetical protein
MGLALVAAAAVAWSTAPFFTRLLPFDSWTILFWRGLFGGGSITAFLLLTQGRAGLVSLISLGKRGWLVASLSTIGMVSFIPALQLTRAWRMLPSSLPLARSLQPDGRGYGCEKGSDCGPWSRVSWHSQALRS